jgi:hypothetical protein
LETAKKAVKEFLAELLIRPKNEREFLEAFRKSSYEPELLFYGKTLARIRNHPMAVWRIAHTVKAESTPQKSLISQLEEAEQEVQNKASQPKTKDKNEQEI